MNDFKQGVMFAAGLALFGKVMYEWGKRTERREDAKRWHLFKVTVEEICKADDKKEES